MKKFIWPLAIIVATALIYFIFIPAFSGQLNVSPEIQLGPVVLRWYGVILGLSILIGFFLARKNSWRFGISINDVDDLSFWLVIIGILGARIYYVLFSLDYFTKYPAEIYKIWHGGLSIYGGILAGLIFVYFYARKKAYTFWQLADVLSLSLPLAQAAGRFGNFVNQEAYGTQTNLPWKMYVNGKYVHPTFLYEALADVAVFLLLWKLVGKVKSGVLAITYLAVYSFFRFFIEGLRADSFYVYGFRADQLVAFLLIMVCGVLFYRRQLTIRHVEK